MKTAAFIHAALLAITAVSIPAVPAAQLLRNGSFDSAAAWTVVPPQGPDWTCIANGEANLHPYPSGYVGTVLQQKLAVDPGAAAKVKLDAVMSRISAPSGKTIAFALSYRDATGKIKPLTIYSPDNDSITAPTPITCTINLPAGTKEITGFSVNKLTNGMFTLQSVSLELVGAAAKPEISVQQPAGSDLTDGTAKRSFGTVKTGRTGVPKTFTIRNTGLANLTGIAITKNGPHAADFTVSVPAATTLAPGASTTFRVTFKPKAAGTRVAAIHIRNNDANENPFDIGLGGQGAK